MPPRTAPRTRNMPPHVPEERESALLRGANLVKKIAIPTGALAGAGILAETGYDGGVFKDIWHGLQTASPTLAMILFVLLLDERQGKKLAEERLFQRTIAFVEATNLASAAFNKLAGALAAHKKKGL